MKNFSNRSIPFTGRELGQLQQLLNRAVHHHQLLMVDARESTLRVFTSVVQEGAMFRPFLEVSLLAQIDIDEEAASNAVAVYS